jgi:formylglycine-generating enzyme required for sulfatase activity
MKGWLVLVSLAFVTLVSARAGLAAEAPPGPVGPNEFRDCPDVCPVMVRVPAGTFRMGDDDASRGAADERPAHPVSVRAFAVGKFEVTHAEYAAFVAASGYQPLPGCLTDRKGGQGWGLDMEASWSDPGYPYGDRQPVVCLNWKEADAYTAWLSKKTGKTYRLLSEAEWEYAYRAGTTTEFFWGDRPEDMCAYANGGDLSMLKHFPRWPPVNCDDGFIDTAPVGSFKPNAFGLYDMAGNAWEWTADCYAPYAKTPRDGKPYEETNCVNRVLRGGSWGYGVVDHRAAQRNGKLTAYIRGGDLGFRVAREL